MAGRTWHAMKVLATTAGLVLVLLVSAGLVVTFLVWLTGF